MAGTLFGLGLQQQLDINGTPLSGCLLYLFQAATSIPVNSFQDFGLTVLNTNPLEADSSGRLPQFWLADGFYRARLTTADGSSTIFDFDSIQTIGASVSGGGGGGGGGGSAVDPNAVLQTGDFLWRPTAGTRAGFVRGNGRTMGSASSGATERANADCQPLFEFLWNNFSDTLCPVGGGRVSATADFLANKTIGILDMRGRGPFGLDDMGNSAAGVISGGTSAAASGGTGAATINQANLPNVNLSAGGLSVNTAITNGNPVVTNISQSTFANYQHGGGFTHLSSINVTSAALSLASGAISGTVPLGGSGTPLTTISPYRLGTWFLKL